MVDDEGNDDNTPTYQIVLEEGFEPLPQRMIIVKVLASGDVHAEDNDGQMLICREDGTIQSFLHGDDKWVKGRLSNTTPWDAIGFYLGMTNGFEMERGRNEKPN